jgi:hypothetical protein
MCGRRRLKRIRLRINLSRTWSAGPLSRIARGSWHLAEILYRNASLSRESNRAQKAPRSRALVISEAKLRLARPREGSLTSGKERRIARISCCRRASPPTSDDKGNLRVCCRPAGPWRDCGASQHRRPGQPTLDCNNRRRRWERFAVA